MLAEPSQCRGIERLNSCTSPAAMLCVSGVLGLMVEAMRETKASGLDWTRLVRENCQLHCRLDRSRP